ncbi:MAG: hypothetical protein JXR77_18830, partial [Lentisphaeria bacterium]|nr:hypothetical protein [Lentisphaeria bacterium]
MRSVCIPVAAAVLGFGLFAGVAGAAEPLLSNGGFEEGTAPWRAGFGPDPARHYVRDGAAAAAGAGCLHIVCEGENAAVDHPELTLGGDLSRLGTYRLSARIRNDGIRNGTFGLRLYFRDAGGGHLAMLGGISLDASTPVHGWREYSAEFGRGTQAPMPPGAARLLVRFSLWAAEGGAVGDVWLDDISLAETGRLSRPDGALPRAVVWQDLSLEALAGVQPGPLEPPLREAGFDVRTVTTDGLLEGGVVDIAWTDLVVLPYGPWVPAPLTSRLLAYLADGGALVTLGPGAFSIPLHRTASGWIPVWAPAPGAVVLPVSFASGWSLAQAGPGDGLEVTPRADGTGAAFHTGNLSGWAYAGIELPAPPGEDVVLSFGARGDAATPRLCLELTEDDTSRWKAVVPLSAEWREYRLHLGEFVSYANAALGREGGTIRPRHVKRLLAGLTAAMVGKGPHGFALADLRFETAAVPTAAVSGTPVPLPPGREVGRWFGKEASPGPWRAAPTVFEGARAWEAKRLVPLADLGPPAAGPIPGSFSGLSVGELVLPAEPKTPSRSLTEWPRSRRAAHRVPLLGMADPPGQGEVVAAAYLGLEGPYAGSRWVAFGMDAGQVCSTPALSRALADAAGWCRDTILCSGVRPRFRATPDGAVLDVLVRLRNSLPRGRSAALRTTVTAGTAAAAV